MQRAKGRKMDHDIKQCFVCDGAGMALKSHPRGVVKVIDCHACLGTGRQWVDTLIPTVDLDALQDLHVGGAAVPNA